MRKIIYSGVDASGMERNGFIEAENNKAALQALKDKGLTDIVLHDDSSTALLRSDLDDLSDKELETIAKLEIKARNKSSLGLALLESIRLNWIIIISGLGIFGVGYWWDSIVGMVIGAVVTLALPLLTIWNYRHASNYNDLLNACATGDFSRALKCIQKLRSKTNQFEIELDLDIREACIVASNNELEKALSIISHWQEELEDISPGLFEFRAASIYHAAGDYNGFLEMMRKGYEKSVESSMVSLDLALAEARFGDIEKAQTLLNEVSEEELPPHAHPFRDWTIGVIEKRKNNASSVKYLAKAVSGLLDFGDNPAVLSGLAVCSGYYAAALLQFGDKNNAASVAKGVWSVLKVNGDKPLLDELSSLNIQ